MVRHLYVHIPFCHHICPYCAFYKHRPGSLANRRFVEALLTEARALADLFPCRPVTVYFGGGTPSMLGVALLERLCLGLAEVFDLRDVREWSIECNPATFDTAKARRMRECGITRASLGVQSFRDEMLRTLGRDHSPGDAIRAYHDLREADFPRIGIDLMFSIPGQTIADWEADLQCAVALAPEHLSCYNLTYEEDTEFLTRHLSGELDASEDRDATLFRRAIEFLGSAGYAHYEISNFARPGAESRHNRAYWEGRDYLGIGPGAVSTVLGERWKSLPDTRRYVETVFSGGDVQVEHENLTEEDRRIESIAMQIRTNRGVERSTIADPTILQVLTAEGLVEELKGRIRLTDRGKALADPVASELIGRP